MLDSLINIFEAGLSLWDTAQSRKYQVAVLDLKLKRAKELDKENPNYNYTDRLERELFYLANLAATEIKRSKTKDL
tara:strand:- start:567 stop:794 length:228 start_codon:yes stop_codon:yes gene_type:complete